MSNQKGQESKGKKSSSKKHISKSNKKITDYFNKNNSGTNSNITDDISANNKKSENNINIKEEMDVEYQVINIVDEDDDNYNYISSDNYIYNNYPNKKNLKKKMEDNNSINNNISSFNDNSVFGNKYPLFFINVNTQSIDDNKRNLILMDIIDENCINLEKIKINPENFANNKDYHKSFPFQNCRILNINNSSYIIGGKLNDNISRTKYYNELGVTDCYKLIYNRDHKEIKIIKISSTIFEHHSHSLLYLQKFNIIVLCSGHKQRKCEVLSLENGTNEKIWEQLHSLRKPRENAISLLFNEKYIFLVGGFDLNGEINNDYDVLNYELYNNSKYQCFWKTFKLSNDNFLLQQKGCGIIYDNDNNNIYIIGGYNKENEFFSWKIKFEEDKKEEKNSVIPNIDKIFKISSVEHFNDIKYFVNQKDNNKKSFSFCGDQVFTNCNDYFANISFGGQMILIPKNLLD